MDPETIGTWTQALTGLGMAGVAWFLLAKRDPEKDKSHREEREQLRATHEAELRAIREEHAEERAEWRSVFQQKDAQIEKLVSRLTGEPK